MDYLNFKELRHSSSLLGMKRENHKYIERIELGRGKYQYIYDQASSAVKSGASKLKSAASSVSSKASTISSAGSKKESSKPNPLTTVKTAVTNTATNVVNDISKRSHKKFYEKASNYADTQVENAKEEKLRESLKDKPPESNTTSKTGNISKGDKKAESELPKKEHATTKKQDMEAVNPGYRYSKFNEEAFAKQAKKISSTYYTNYDDFKKDLDVYYALYDKTMAYQNNCMWCTECYDLRRRGYDVTAAPNGAKYKESSDGPYFDNGDSDYDGVAEELNTYYEDPVLKQAPTGNYKTVAKQVENELLAEGDGAYGQLMVYWIGGGGHSMVWEVENGEVVVRDCQLNTTYNLEDVLKDSKTYEQGGVTTCRVDNLHLKDEIFECVTTTSGKENQVKERK